MSCDQLHMVQRLAVDKIEALETYAWQEHLADCEECRAEWNGFSRSLAVFRQLEQERVSRFTNSPSWEEFSEKLVMDWRRWRIFRQLRIPAAAAVVVMFTVGGVSMWAVGGGEKLSPQVAAESAAHALPETSERALPRIPSTIPRQLNFVFSRPVALSGAVSQRPQKGRSYVFDLRGSGGTSGIVGITTGNDGRGPGVTSERPVISPASAIQSEWRPPIASRVPGQPARVDYPVHVGQTQ